MLSTCILITVLAIILVGLIKRIWSWLGTQSEREWITRYCVMILPWFNVSRSFLFSVRSRVCQRVLSYFTKEIVAAKPLLTLWELLFKFGSVIFQFLDDMLISCTSWILKFGYYVLVIIYLAPNKHAIICVLTFLLGCS